MKRKTWSVEEKLRVIQEAEVNGAIATCRKHGIYASTYYTWKEKYEEGGVEALKPQYGKASINPEIKRLEEENMRLKKLLAEKELILEIKEELLKKTLQQRKPK
jgi:putative transposase